MPGKWYLGIYLPSDFKLELYNQ